MVKRLNIVILLVACCLFAGFDRIQSTEEQGLQTFEEEDLLVPINGFKIFDNKIALGGYSTTVLNETNGVFEWGILTNANEPRKLMFLDPNNEPIDFTTENRKHDLLDIACGGYYCLALIQDVTRDQSLFGWGRVPLSNENHAQPVVLSEFNALLKEHRIKKMSAGYEHVLFVTTEKKLIVWGDGKSGQLGVEGLRETRQPVVVTSLIGQNIDVKAACGGGHHSMILTSDGKVYATGWNKFGQLGLGADHDTQVFEHVTLPEKAHKISCGGDHSLALTKTGSIYAWGWGEYGQLGQGNTDNCNAPRRVNGAELFIHAVASPYAHNLILTKSHQVYSFGWGANGQLGHGGRVPELIPRKIDRLRDIHAVAAGFKHSAFVNGEGELYLLGDSEYFQVPGPSTENMRIEDIVAWHNEHDEENTTALHSESEEIETIVL